MSNKASKNGYIREREEERVRKGGMTITEDLRQARERSEGR